MEGLSEVKALLSIPRNIVITSHRNPDGDAVGSSLALYLFLSKFGHSVRIALPSDYPANYSWMPGIEEIKIWDLDSEQVEEYIHHAEIVFCLDFNSLDRIDKIGEKIHDKDQLTKILIDHHRDPELNSFDFALTEPDASSTCELVYQFIADLDLEQEIDKSIATCLYTGIITDTGSFKYNTNGRVFKMVGNLIERGVEDVKIQNAVYNSMSVKQLKLLAYCLHERLEIFPEYNTGMITLTKQDYKNFDIQRGDTEGIVNYILMIKEIRMAAFITEQPTIIKLSLRSKGDFSVQQIAKKYFKGGGHLNASGGHMYGSLKKCVHKFISILPEYKNELTKADDEKVF